MAAPETARRKLVLVNLTGCRCGPNHAVFLAQDHDADGRPIVGAGAAERAHDLIHAVARGEEE